MLASIYSTESENYKVASIHLSCFHSFSAPASSTPGSQGSTAARWPADHRTNPTNPNYHTDRQHAHNQTNCVGLAEFTVKGSTGCVAFLLVAGIVFFGHHNPAVFGQTSFLTVLTVCCAVGF